MVSCGFKAQHAKIRIKLILTYTGGYPYIQVYVLPPMIFLAVAVLIGLITIFNTPDF